MIDAPLHPRQRNSSYQSKRRAWLSLRQRQMWIGVWVLFIITFVPSAYIMGRGILRSIVPPATNTPVVLRASGGPSVLKELSNEEVAIDIDDALRLNVSALAVLPPSASAACESASRRD